MTKNEIYEEIVKIRNGIEHCWKCKSKDSDLLFCLNQIVKLQIDIKKELK